MNTIGKREIPYVPIIILALAVTLVVVGFVFRDKVVPTFLLGKSAINVQTIYGSAEVHLDGKSLGNTPVQLKDVSAKKHKVKLISDKNEYDVSLNFVPKTEIAISRDLGVSQVFSSGQNFWMERDSSGSVLSVISDPANATVYIDNVEVGKTPYSDSALSEGEYDLRISYSGYEVQNTRINISRGYKLNVSFDLFPLPVPIEIKEFEGSDGLYNIISDNIAVTTNVQEWVEAIIYWNETRGVNLSETGMNKNRVFDYFIDYEGAVYDREGQKMGEDLSGLSELKQGAYLARISDPEGLTASARESYQKLTGLVVVEGKKATISDTGVGWLRVRNAPGLNGEEVARATVGETYAVLEEGIGWVKIKLDETTEGWVSADYVELSE